AATGRVVTDQWSWIGPGWLSLRTASARMTNPVSIAAAGQASHKYRFHDSGNRWVATLTITGNRTRTMIGRNPTVTKNGRRTRASRAVCRGHRLIAILSLLQATKRAGRSSVAVSLTLLRPVAGSAEVDFGDVVVDLCGQAGTYMRFRSRG